MYAPNDPNVKLGELGISIARRYLVEHSWQIVPVDKAGGSKASLIFSDQGNYPAPDILAMKGGKTAWFDGKTKTQSTYTRNRNRGVINHSIFNIPGEDHGIDLHSLEHYKKATESGGQEVFIIIVELKREVEPSVIVWNKHPIILVFRLDDCYREDGSRIHALKGMAYYRREAAIVEHEMKDINTKEILRKYNLLPDDFDEKQ